jgi:predicted nucleic acid-binding protein
VAIYVDSSALLKRYLEEPDADDARARLLADPVWVTARVTLVESVRVLSAVVPRAARATVLDAFRTDWRRMNVVELDATTCERAAELASALDVRALDALHLAAAHRTGGPALPFLTYDHRQARAARALGWTVLGV